MSKYRSIRHKHFNSTTLKELFSDVDIRCILGFTNESRFYPDINNFLVNPVFRFAQLKGSMQEADISIFLVFAPIA